jgi:hypothetical protein
MANKLDKLKVCLVLEDNEIFEGVSKKLNDNGYPVLYIGEDLARIVVFPEELQYPGYLEDIEKLDMKMITSVRYDEEGWVIMNRIKECLFFYFKNDDGTFETFDNRQVTITEK